MFLDSLCHYYTIPLIVPTDDTGDYKTACAQGTFECRNRQCVPNEFVCDREDDCGDGSDEPTFCGRNLNYKNLFSSTYLAGQQVLVLTCN